MITLVLAWCLAGVRSSAFMKTLFPNHQYLLKAHIDYLLMTGLLMIFFLLFNRFRVSPSPVVVFTMSIGSFMRPAKADMRGCQLDAHPPSGNATAASNSRVMVAVSFSINARTYATCGSCAWRLRNPQGFLQSAILCVLRSSDTYAVVRALLRV